MTLKALILYSGMTQKRLAETSGVGESQISDFVRGKRPIPNHRRLDMLRALGFSPRAWGHLEGAFVRLQAEREDLVARSHAHGEIGEGGLPESELTDRDGSDLDALDADRADELSTWIGTNVEALVRGTIRRLRDPDR